MKRSKIFLGVTTCLLAVAGVATANHFRSSITRWYITLGTGFPVTKHCVPTSTITCTYDASKTTTCFYKPVSTKSFVVFTSGTPGTDITKCVNKFVFTRND